MSCDAECQGANDFCAGYDKRFHNPRNIAHGQKISDTSNGIFFTTTSID